MGGSGASRKESTDGPHQFVRDTRLRQEQIASGAFRPIAIGVPCTRRDDEERNRGRVFVALQSADQLNPVHVTRQQKFRHDSVNF
jgi:hypothetical protein